MGMPAAGPVTSTAGATRIIVLENCVQRDELLQDECAFLSQMHATLMLGWCEATSECQAMAVLTLRTAIDHVHS